ncbi:MAG: hypothetical protein M1826_007413 [Phylliscum demangeonii]|nr:MAG: hypothetical protein M1826_007413 [Phylliscum demangeonii]
MDRDALKVAPRSSAVDQTNTIWTKDSLIHDVAGHAPADGATWFSQLAGNPFFTAGFGLAGLATALAIARRGVQQGASLLRRRLLVDVEISRNDESYHWFLHWMSCYQQGQQQSPAIAHPSGHEGVMASLLRRLTPGLHHLSIQTSKISHPNGSLDTRFALIPGPGRHLLWYRNTFLAVHRARETKAMDLQTGAPWETVTLTTLYAQRHVFHALFTDAHRLAMQLQQGKTVVYTAWGTEWRPFGSPRRKRPLASVILDRGVQEGIVADVQDFLGCGPWYQDRGIPYRRGYLLHGPPGTGKSSFIQALAGHLDYNIAILNLSERGLTDDRLNHLLTQVPARTIILLEDVDAAFGARRAATDADGYRGAHVTFSGLLNALDGVASAEERLIFLTTNHVERLDDALIRPGRVDLAVRLGPASRWQVEQLWDRFYGDVDGAGRAKRRFVQTLARLGVLADVEREEAGDGDGDGLGATVPAAAPVSPAALQGLFLHHKRDMEGAIRAAAGFVPPTDPVTSTPPPPPPPPREEAE